MYSVVLTQREDEKEEWERREDEDLDSRVQDKRRGSQVEKK
jgi:hypothetical protein